ncbi:pyocin knob domain-containing protein [Oscillibacter valericigenes]|nr:pyocin knob domain-containing protein [Oscillibacter valericigenes]
MSFQGPIYTDAGKALHNRLIGTGTLKFTKMQMGDGSLGGTTITTLTALINPLVTMEVQRLKQYSDYIVVTAPFANATITTAFNWREIGLFAADPNYPDDRTKDILFCYQNAYSSAASIPPGSQEFIERLVNIPIKLSDVSDVTITISASLIYALKDPATGKIYPDDIPDLNYISMAQKGAANGVATLGEDGKVTPSQVDYLLKSIVAAADYDPAATYAAGAYCIKAGTLYKCTTPITVAEAWNAGHWTETTVEAELLAIIAALAGKVNKAGDTITGDMTFKGINAYTDVAWVTPGLMLADKNTVRTGWLAVAGNGTDKCDFWLANDHGDVSLRPMAGGKAKVGDAEIATANKVVARDGSIGSVNPVTDVNNFWNGLATFDGTTAANLPSGTWYALEATGDDGSGTQIATNLFAGYKFFRYKASAVWSAWRLLNQELTATVPVSWTASGGYYYQNVSVPGILSGDRPFVDFLPTGDNAANELYAEAWSKVIRIDAADGYVQIWCKEAPVVQFMMQFKVVR